MAKLEGSARGLADSVEPQLEVQTPVANNGSAFALNMVSIALWIGAVMAGSIFNLRLIHAEHAGESNAAKTIGKFIVPALVALFQASLTFAMRVFVLEVRAPSYTSFALTMAMASLAFLGMIFALLRIFG
ncbi:MAG: hypothetical protein MO853_01985 [Candidatus Protistobacter heckmanni]|nr:hypothetical protein [Candidatus Protistobacter heckmanni]